MSKLPVLVGAGILASGLSFAALAQSSAESEINTAHAHALMAESATTVAKAHAHLHHVINCLVGPNGAGFDAAAGDPCKGQGDGAVSDSAADPALKSKLRVALADARSGLKSHSLSDAHKNASKAAAALQGQ